jgi:hypothetical protein
MAVLSREFALDPTILGKGSTARLAVSGATQPATLAAIAANTPFPSAVDLGDISLGAGTGQGVRFAAGDTAVTFKGETSLASGVGIFDAPADALKSLALDRPNAVDLKLPPIPGSRWALMRWRYETSGTVSGSHPLGAIGAATLGVDAKGEAAYAVLHGFSATTGAQDVLGATISSWRLPRQVALENGDVNIRPLTWIVAEADGSLAVTVSARLGYDVSFTHESALLGLTRDFGATIDANLKATLGLSVAGRYAIVIGREDPSATSRVVRLRLHRLSKKGLGFGLNLNVGVKGVSPLPARFDDFVQTVFGVHGPQVLKDLHVIEEWTDPSKDLGQTAARLATSTGLSLLQTATGLDVPARFHDARRVVVEALNRWDGLPDRLSSMLWQYLSRATPAEVDSGFRKILAALASGDLERRSEALRSALQDAPVSDSAITAWLQAVSDQGLLALGRDLERVGELAGQTLAILDGGTIRKLQQFIATKLDLGPLRQAIKDDDFGVIDEWLVRRLADLLNKPGLHLADLKEVQQAIFAVDKKVRTIYDEGVKALTKRYSGELATTYQRTAADTALLDASFDLGIPAALAEFRTVVDTGRLDDLLLHHVEGVSLHAAALTHGIQRQAHVEVHLPSVTAESSRVTESLAKLTVEEQAGRVLVYEFDATDTVTTANRARSELSVLGAFRVSAAPGSVRPAASGTIAYEARQAQRAMRAADLESRTRPFIEGYLGQLFPDATASIPAFYAAVSASAPGGPAALGDVAISTELSYPAEVLQGWLLPRDEEAVRRDSMRLSRAVQASIKRLLARTYLDDLDHVHVVEPVAALLVWASLPLSTSADVQAAPIRFNTDRDVFWNYVAPEVRRAIVGDPHTVRALQARLATIQARLREAGRRDADRFEPQDAARFVQLALERGGDVYLSSLLTAEALMIGGAVRALRKIAEAIQQSQTGQAAAVRALSEFAATLVETFGGHLQFVYSGEAVRTLGPMMLAEASAAVHPAFQNTSPSAALRLYVLKAGHAFKLEAFLQGELPSADNVAIAETLVWA